MNTMEDSLEVRKTNSPYRDDPRDRVVVILDVKNITCRQCQEYANTVIDYPKLLRDVVGGRHCVAAIAVDGVVYDDRGRDVSRTFHSELKDSGFRVELVPASNNKGKQEGVDIKIALLAQKFVLQNRCDIVELMTGDGDFTVLAKDLQADGVRVNVTSFLRNLSYSLKDSADDVRLLDDLLVVRMAQGCAEGEI